MSQAAPVSLSPSFASSLLSSSLAQTSTTTDDEPTASPIPQSHSNTGAIIGGTIGGLCALLLAALFALLFWRKRKRRLLREQQIAIRRMTIVGPPSSVPPTLPYPFLGHGHRQGNFNFASTSGAGDIEMSTSKNSTNSGKQEAGLPKTRIPAPVCHREQDRIGRGSEQTLVADLTAPDSASVYSSKQSDVGDGDGIVFVDGIYVLALEHDNDRPIDRKSGSVSSRGAM